jgi:predicted dehydrogenase
MNRPTTHPIRAAIIGTGTIAGEHAAVMHQLRSQISLVSASDIDDSRLELFRRKFKIPHGTMNPEELIRDRSIELIVVATPPSLHEQYVIAGLQNGKFVLCEKPLAHTLASARNICRIAEQFPGRVAVGYQMRYSLAFQRLRWLCKNGIGDLKSARLERHSYIPNSDHGKAGWWGKWSVAGGGMLLTQMIHELDLLISLFGRPTQVEAFMDTRFTQIESEDVFEASIAFSNGGIAVCRGSVNSGDMRGCFDVQGTLGTAGLSSTLTLNNAADEQAVMRSLNRSLPHTRPSPTGIVSRIARAAKRRLNLEAPPYTPHMGFYTALVQSVRNAAPVPMPPAEAMNSLELCMAIYESAITNRPVELPMRPDSCVFNGITPELYGTRCRTSSLVLND